MVQVILGVIVLILLLVLSIIFYRVRKNQRQEVDVYGAKDMNYLLKKVKVEVVEMIRDDKITALDDTTYQAVVNRKRRIREALRKSVDGVESASNIVKAIIKTIIEKELRNVDEVCAIIDFTELMYLPAMIKFEILLYRLKKQKESSKNPIDYLNNKYNLIELVDYEHPNRKGIGQRRIFDEIKLNWIFEEEVVAKGELTYNEMLDVMAVLLFQKYKGYGCISTLLSMPIDGLHYGTSGSIRYIIEGNYDVDYKDTNSVWVQINAEWVHFSFLDFYRVEEMMRVTNQITSFGISAPMTEKRPYKVVDGYDGSRRTAIRPPSGESWACFIRKFSLGKFDLAYLLDKPNYHNTNLVMELLYYLSRSAENFSVTGQQNTGKTTLLKSLIGYVDDTNIRVLEMSFELALREIYPFKDVLTVKPTDYVTSSELQDLLKKTDGAVSLAGEVAEDIVAARAIQFGRIGSARTMFSHHAKTDDDLIYGFTNSLVACGEYKSEETALDNVLDVIKHNVHAEIRDTNRYIGYVSEIIKLDTIKQYKPIKKSDDVGKAIDQLSEQFRDFAQRSTDRVRFVSNKIITFNWETKTYEPAGWYTDETAQRIYNSLNDKDREGFVNFYKTHFMEVDKRNKKRLKESGVVK